MADVNVNEGDSTTPEEQIYESCMTCEPALAAADMECLADMVVSRELVIRPWRLTALLASKGGDFYRELAADESKARALATTPDVLRAFAERLRGVADLADCAAARVLVAGCSHAQFNEWANEDEAPA